METHEWINETRYHKGATCFLFHCHWRAIRGDQEKHGQVKNKLLPFNCNGRQGQIRWPSNELSFHLFFFLFSLCPLFSTRTSDTSRIELLKLWLSHLAKSVSFVLHPTLSLSLSLSLSLPLAYPSHDHHHNHHHQRQHPLSKSLSPSLSLLLLLLFSHSALLWYLETFLPHLLHLLFLYSSTARFFVQSHIHFCLQ